MENLGTFVLILALALATFGTVASLIAAIHAKERFRKAAVRAYLAASVLILVAVIALGILLQQDSFDIVYVHNHSNVALPWYYKLTAIWGGSQGSLLWWTLILAVYFCAWLGLTKKVPRLMLSWAMFFAGLNLMFFLVINNFVSPPFDYWGQIEAGQVPIPFNPADGRGLNPQLQHWAMIIHPPLLYIGYIGFLFPFAMALGALIARVEGRTWVRLIRRWTLMAWLILGVGIILGGAWAYMELGWGGYWAWDPVENASFMPWLLATAFIHSVMAQEKRGMFKVWNILLLLGTYLMCLFGTFITRSGLISSVHAFAESDIGWYFIAFIGILTVLSAVVLISRRGQLQDDNSYDSFKSREVGLLFNNVLFVTICITMLMATVYPMITEFFTGTKRELRHGFYNTVEIPIFLGLMLLMALGPVLTWKRTSNRLLRERFLWPSIVMVVVFVIGLFVNQTSMTANVSAAILSFLGFTIIHEFAEVIIRRARRAKENFAVAFYTVVQRNKRRYGGYMAHFSILLMAFGITGAAFNQQDKQELGVGESMTVAGYNFQVESIDVDQTDPNFQALIAKVNLIEDGEITRVFYPEQRFYYSSEMQASEIGIDVTLTRDYYVVLAGLAEDSFAEAPIGVFHVYVNPLVIWIWFGSVLMIFATVVCMLPERATARVTANVSSAIPQGEPA